ncbi:MAG TPA: hypothetical protein V6C84_03475 [Coleofasciculaceae cyanobacterium]
MASNWANEIIWENHRRSLHISTGAAHGSIDLLRPQASDQICPDVHSTA